MKLSRISRVVQLLCVLQSGQCYCPDDLMKVLGVSRRTVFRDLQELGAIGVPYYFDSEAGGYRIDPDFFLPPIDLTLQEALSLLMLIHKGRSHLPGALKRSALLGGLKIENNLPVEIKHYCAATLEHISIQPGAHSAMGSMDNVFWRLQKALERKQKVRLEYLSLFEGEKIVTVLCPHHLMFKHRGWYVVGNSSLHKEIRTFKLGRIKSLSLLSRFFTRKRTFAVEDYLGSAWSMIPEGKLYHVRLEFSAKVGKNVSEVQWHRSQKMVFNEDGSVTAEFRVDGLGEISWWVLGYGGEVKVLAPAALKRRIVGIAKKMVEINH